MLHEVVDEHGPGALLVVVGEVVVDGEHEVQQQVPGVPRDVTPVVLLAKVTRTFVRKLKRLLKLLSPGYSRHLKHTAPKILQGNTAAVLSTSHY